MPPRNLVRYNGNRWRLSLWLIPKVLPFLYIPCPSQGPAQAPALTSAEHQAQRGLTARHCLQEFTPRVVQMLPPETAKQSNYSPQNPNSRVLSHQLLSSQSPTRALLYPCAHLQTLDVASLLSPASYELGFLLPKAEHRSLPPSSSKGPLTPAASHGCWSEAPWQGVHASLPTLLQTLWGSRSRKGEFPRVQGGTHSPARDCLPLPITLTQGGC